MDGPKAENFIWDDLEENIVQPPLLQTYGGCAFTATVRQLEYQVRIAYAKASPPIKLNPIDQPIFDHIFWQNHLSQMHPHKTVYEDRWTPWQLLGQAYDQYIGEGCPTRKCLQHWVDKINQISSNKGESVKVEEILEQISRKMPVIAIINIFVGLYEPCGKSIYIGKPPPTENSEIEKLPTHAVVIVGSYKAIEGNRHKLPPGMYFLYQDSMHNEHTNVQGKYGNCISILHPQVIISVLYGLATVPSLLVADGEVDEARAINHARLLTRRSEVANSSVGME